MLYGDGIHDETKAIQELLDNCGIVRIEKPGTYLISKTLKIHSNTRFELSPGAKLLAAPMSRCALIENDAFRGDGRDENIEIIGGIWDGNCDEMGLDATYEARHRLDQPYHPDLFKGKLIRFAHIDRIHLSKMTVRNPVSYGIQIGDVYGFVVRDIFFDYNWHFGTTDGVHINGPARDGVIENLCGTTNDDMVSLTPYDEEHAEVTRGNIENVYIHSISAKNGFSGVRLLAGDGFSLCSVHIDGLYGDYRHHGIIISNHNDRPGSTWFDDITIENLHISKSHTPLSEECFRLWEPGTDSNGLIEFGKKAICGRVTVRNVYRDEKESSIGALFKLHETAKIDTLLLDNVYQSQRQDVSAPFWENHGEIKELIKSNVNDN